MSEMKHTPGPWRVGNVRTQRVDSRLQPMFEAPVHYGNGNCHTIVYGGGPGALHSDHESVLANAILIAAAPELLEALRQVLKHEKWHAMVADEVTDEAKAAIKLAEAAISKATGGAQ